MPQKNLSEHQLQCTSVLMTSDNCQMTYIPSAPPLPHSEMNCLREQFEHYRFVAQSEIQELRKVQGNSVKKFIF
jgi:hypothetical protein